MARRRNPFNATKPAEWATMSKKLRKSWNRRHWRPDQWKCDLALKKEATRLKHRQERAGQGLMSLAERMVERDEATNPARRIPIPAGERITGRGLRAAFRKAFPSRASCETTRIGRANPYPHEHSARIRSPLTMLPSSFRRKNVEGGAIGLIMGKPLTGRQVMTLQSVRFRAAYFSPSEAKRWLKRHKLRPVLFEAATKSRAKSWAAEGARGKKSRRSSRARALTKITKRRRYA